MVRAIAIGCALATAFLGSAAFAAELDIDRLAGLYTYGFMNGNIEGHKYWSDDVLEIVKLSPNTAYINIRLEFFNGHQCSLSGVAEAAGPSLVYSDPKNQCELHLDVADGKITFEDKDGHCRDQSCGMRGMYTGEKFKLSSRRPITYMPKLLASFQYLEAIKEYQARHEQ